MTINILACLIIALIIASIYIISDNLKANKCPVCPQFTRTNYFLRQYVNNENEDRNVVYDKLTMPNRSLINYPTQGYPRKPRLIGKLIANNNNNINDKYKFLLLFLREIIPNRQYQYYATTESSMSNLKFDIDVPSNKELLDNDKIFIDTLQREYTVRLHKNYDYIYIPL